MLHASIVGAANPAKRPEVRVKISENLSANHPAKTNPEPYRRHADRIRPAKVSKLEDVVAPFLVGFARQHKVRWYAIDFADTARMIAVEVQGCWHHVCPVCFPCGPEFPMQRATLGNDRRKNRYLTSHGWAVVYLWEHDVRADPEGCVRFNVPDLERV